MNPFKRIRDAIRRQKVNKTTQELANQLFVNPLCSDYENVFAQVRPLINDMAVVRPYGVGRNGGKLTSDRTPELNILDAPNDQMGWFDFASSMFASWLTEDELDIHVHFAKSGRIDGYTIIPAGSKSWDGTRYYWDIKTEEGIKTVYDDEVMQLYFSRSPKNLYEGISPATSVRAWAQTEDVLAQYQRAFIENGAIPASITFIRASSYQKFEEAQRKLEGDLRGAKNKNKTIYIWRQYDNDSGTEQDQVEIKTIQGNNSTLAIKELSDIINDHLNKAYGVSNFILGDDSSAKYDNAELSDYQFIKRRVYPALLAFWSQFQHELDRITGGLGYSIQFDIELPDLTERKRVKAETARINVENLTNLIKSGSRPVAAVKALNLGDEWVDVARGIYSRAVVESMLPSLANKNNPPETSDKCQEENYLPKDNGADFSHDHCCCENDALPEMTATERAIYNELVDMARKIMEQDSSLDEEAVIAKLDEILNGEALKGQEKGAKALEMLTNDDIKAEIAAQIKEGLTVSEALKVRINNRTTELVKNYGSEAKRLFDEVLNSAEGKSANEIRKELREVMPTYQAERIARNETLYAFRTGDLEQSKQFASKYNLKVKLTWRCRHDGATCPVCQAMDGQTTILGSPFTDSVETDDGLLAWEHSSWNDGGQIPAAHPNCRCYFEEELI